MKDQQLGVFFLRTTGEDPPLTRADAQFAETVIRTAVAAIEKAYDFETAVSDKKRLEKLAATDALTGALNRRALSEDRKSTRLNSSHLGISYAVFCLKKK